jgi:hypothetical protein
MLWADKLTFLETLPEIAEEGWCNYEFEFRIRAASRGSDSQRLRQAQNWRVAEYELHNLLW